MLGVDRLDYTKGIDQRLRAVYEIFDKGNHTVDDLVLVQVVFRLVKVSMSTLKYGIGLKNSLAILMVNLEL